MFKYKVNPMAILAVVSWAWMFIILTPIDTQHTIDQAFGIFFLSVIYTYLAVAVEAYYEDKGWRK